MKIHGRTSVHEFLGNSVVYRNLVPQDPGLPALAQIRPALGFADNFVPRKSQPEYAQVIVHMLNAAQALRFPGRPIERLVYVGDTQLNDGNAFANISRVGGWPGLCFIGADRKTPPHIDVIRQDQYVIYVANRWQAIADFAGFLQDENFAIDETTAIVVDLDKTALGARGRNDHVIDGARVEAVRRTVGELLGDDFNPEAFQTSYDILNQPEFHPFTADNQDYLAYICLILGSGIFQLDPLVAEVRARQMTSFQQFIAAADERKAQLPSTLAPIHKQIHDLVEAGDPTPFKDFRYNEYRVTVEHMACLDDGASVESLLEQEIVVTEEVRQKALEWRSQGALLFGLSDKPDEASIPSSSLAQDGYRAIHQTETHAIGE